MKRKPTDLLNPKDARPMGTDSKGTLWVDGNAKGIRTQPTSPLFRANFDVIKWPTRHRKSPDNRGR